MLGRYCLQQSGPAQRPNLMSLPKVLKSWVKNDKWREGKTMAVGKGMNKGPRNEGSPIAHCHFERGLKQER